MNFNTKRKIDELEEGLNRNKNNPIKLNEIKNKIIMLKVNPNNKSYLKRRSKLMEKVECPICNCMVNRSNMNQHKTSFKHRSNIDPKLTIKRAVLRHKLKTGHIRSGKKKTQFIYNLNGKRHSCSFLKRDDALLAQKYYILFYPFIEFNSI